MCVCVCVCMCVCVYVCMCVCVYVCMCLCACMLACLGVCSCVCACVVVCMFAFLYSCLCVHICMPLPVSMSVLVSPHDRIYIHVYCSCCTSSTPYVSTYFSCGWPACSTLGREKCQLEISAARHTVTGGIAHGAAGTACVNSKVCVRVYIQFV